MSKKRGNGEGSIYRRKDGRWVGQYLVYLPTGPKYRYIYGTTRKIVAEKLTKALSDREDGFIFDAGTITLGEYLDRWLSDSVRDTVRENTFVRYEGIVRLHIKPTLGRVKLKSLTPTHIRALYREKLDTGFSKRSVNYVHVTLHKALKSAVADGLIPRNATEGVKSPSPKRREEIRAMTPLEVRALFEAAIGDRYEALYILAVNTGLRQGELLGLRWEDLDLETATLRVRRTLQNGRLYPPKSGKGRNVKMTRQTVDAVRSHRKRQLEEQIRLARVWEDQGLVFPNRAGRPLDHTNFYQRDFKKLLDRARLSPTFRFHDLRHTCATLLLSRNVNPKIVQEMLGHATITQTMDTYSHVLPNMQEEAVSALEGTLS